MLTVYGCHSSSDDDSEGAERPLLGGFNAVPDMPQITFLREEEVWSALAYGNATVFRSVDTGQYDINFDALLPGDETTACAGDVDKDDFKDDDECTRLTSESINVLNDHEYVVAMFGRYANLRVQVYDKTAHEFDTSDDDGDPEDDNAEIQFFHWSDLLGAVDVYVEPPGTNLSAVQVRATLSVGEQYSGLVDAGSYVLSLTAVGDPSSPVFTSEDFTLTEQTHVAFAILEGTEDGTSPVRVSRFRDQGGDLLDRRVETELRVTHVARDAGDVDVFAQEDYTAAFVAGLVFGQTSPYQVIAATELASLELDITPAGNPGVLLGRELMSLSAGGRYTLFLVEPTSTVGVDGLLVQDRLRRLAPFAALRLVNNAGVNLDFYVIPHGNNVYTSTATESLSTGSSGTVHLFEPGSYDVVLARAGTDTYVFGPLNVELSGSGVYTAVGVATPDATRSDVVLLDDFVN
jgi:hypothetical protein